MNRTGKAAILILPAALAVAGWAASCLQSAGAAPAARASRVLTTEAAARRAEPGNPGEATPSGPNGARTSGDAHTDGDDWDNAEPGYRFSFPRDHASHENYRIEWWYYTGNLTTSDGRRFGYQLTFFRTGIVRNPVNPSRWTVRDLYMAHFAITDVSNNSLHYFERMNRAGIGWAGADTSPYHVWNEDWQVRLDGVDHLLTAKAGDYSIDLRLAPAKAEVVNGEDGISRKGSEAGNASHYYSITRLKTSGSLEVGGEKFQVTGLNWMDHEFGSSFLEPGQVGWDWFSIQLDDGRDLMIWEIRRKDGSIDPFSSGTLVDADGRSRHIRVGDFHLTPGATWRSSASGATYPVGWTVDIPSEQIHLEVKAAIQNQELRTPSSTGVTYWEGCVNITGEAASHAVTGRGYLEMTGYAPSAGLDELMH